MICYFLLFSSFPSPQDPIRQNRHSKRSVFVGDPMEPRCRNRSVLPTKGITFRVCIQDCSRSNDYTRMTDIPEVHQFGVDIL